MSGPKPPGRESEEPDSAREVTPEPAGAPRNGELADDHDGEFGGDHHLEEPLDDHAAGAADQAGQTDAYSRAYSAPVDGSTTPVVRPSRAGTA